MTCSCAVLIAAASLLWLLPSSSWGQIVDDFSQGGWQRSESTPGTLTVEPGKLHLVDGPEPPAWVTTTKVFQVDCDQTPVFVVKVAALSNRGTVKLIRRKPADKRVALSIDEPGLHSVNVREAYGWTGICEIETCLYGDGDPGEITFEFVKFVAALTAEEQREVTERTAPWDSPRLQVAPFELVPLFQSCSYYFTSPPRPGLRVQFRRSGTSSWSEALSPSYFPSSEMYRGSIVRLQEATGYELRILDGTSKPLAQGEFRTWESEVPIAETIVLDESNFHGHLQINRSGSPSGWLRYTAKPGFVLRNDRKGPLLELIHAKHVILEGLTLRGGLQTAISIQNCRDVRVINCDLAGWGRIGTQRFDINGMYYTSEGKAINWDTGILIRRSIGTVVERCYIHDPLTTANSWYYAHPAGPQAIGIAKPRSTVLRYNDFVGSDVHRWNDATEGEGNFEINGGFNRDADIHGNFVCFANDDALEIDGGQTNIRVFDNWYEGCLCGVSIQGCMSGPSYVFDNLLVNMGDERGIAGQTIKTSSGSSGPDAVSYILGNTSFGPARDLGLLKHLRIVARNNLFAGKSNISGQAESPQSDCDYNLQSAAQPGAEPHGVTGDPGLEDPAAGRYGLRENSPALRRGEMLANFTAGDPGTIDLGAMPRNSNRVLPLRPAPIALDQGHLRFTAAETAAGASKTVVAKVQEPGFNGRFRIAQNEAFDWFTVSPPSGSLADARPVTLQVRVHPERMKSRAIYRGAFLVRLDNGLSRPLTIYAATGFQPPVKPTRDGVWTQFLEAEDAGNVAAYSTSKDSAASGGQCVLLSGDSKAKPLQFSFAVPKAGKYYLVLRVRGEAPSDRHDSIRLGIDDGELEKCQLRTSDRWSWCLAAQNRAMSLICLQNLDLTAGPHVAKIAPQEAVFVDAAALTTDPKIFE